MNTKRRINSYREVIDPKHFWERVDVKNNTEECWEWKNALNTTGYGLYNSPSPDWLYEITGRPRCQLLAHRVAYFIHNGLIGDDHVNNHVRHTCDNQKCCNPHHMFQGSMYGNVQDMIRKDRANFNGGKFVTN
jgi:hypothetical protein